MPRAAAARGGGDGGGGEDGGGEGVGGEQRRSGDMSPTAMYQIKYMRKPALKKDVAVLLAKYRERSRTLWNNKNRPSALVEGASSAEAAKKAAVEISQQALAAREGGEAHRGPQGWGRPPPRRPPRSRRTPRARPVSTRIGSVSELFHTG